MTLWSEQFADSEPPAAADKAMCTNLHDNLLSPGASARMGMVRFRHGGSIRAGAYAPDGKRLASGSADTRLLVCDSIGQFQRGEGQKGNPKA